ncbi:MAG: ribosome biogenesis GTPase YlqF [Ruminococcaceae bacterium]|nr:ribosome biogenesis GTPase YlqF [Oscillospiraceae bacterium]
MPSDIIQWFPGHMAKTRRLITENLKEVDVVIELRDARIPYSSKNPEIAKLCSSKPILTLMNKAGLADPAANEAWAKYAKDHGLHFLFTDCITSQGISSITPAIKELLADKLQKYQDKGMTGRAIKAMIVGIPNVGKSSLINKLCKSKKVKVENRPGVTLAKQWVPTSIGIDLMDMPGVLWPKFEDKTVGENLAITGAIRDKVLNLDEISLFLLERLSRLYPELIAKRYNINDLELIKSLEPYELFELIGKKRGMLISGGDIDTDRVAIMLMDEFRSAKIGRITLELPESDSSRQD